ncbi:GNAT family N-acetyltransferase [Actinotalea sp. K2]|uniref:GNAT family N-acetyltransferase n=1 Tax=Actinotalea sp. K2 TaxID=2939438 RepID=UPI002016FAB2|nr:GNAT family N-acetyltransferase [Actinotalea sp. K2]MCL3861696.1 N-acetyltransferase [Actinotalea sp. K2]
MPRVVHAAERSRYELVVDDAVVGHLEYSERRGGDVALLHTEVDERRQEKGLGSALVRGVLDDLRAREVRIVPLCPFVRAFLERHPEYRDLVATDA